MIHQTDKKKKKMNGCFLYRFLIESTAIENVTFPYKTAV